MLLARLLVEEFRRAYRPLSKVGGSKSEVPALSLRSCWPGDERIACAEALACCLLCCRAKGVPLLQVRQQFGHA